MFSIAYWKLNRKIFETAFVMSLAWRTDVLFYRLYDLIEPIALLLLWTVLFRDHTTLVGYDRASIVTYVLISRLFDTLAVNYVHEEVGTSIKEGRITHFLLKPIRHARVAFWWGTGSSITSKVFSLLITSLLILIVRESINIAPVEKIALALLVTFLAFIINTLIAIAFGYVAFWLGSTAGFLQSLYVVRWFFSGLAFPLDILGPAFFSVSRALPFAYASFIPAQIYLGRMTIMQGIFSVAIEILWIFILWQVVKFLWKRGSRQYEGVGI